MIFYFSGTGNSRWVAQSLSTHLQDTLLYNIEDLSAPHQSSEEETPQPPEEETPHPPEGGLRIGSPSTSQLPCVSSPSRSQSGPFPQQGRGGEAGERPGEGCQGSAGSPDGERLGERLEDGLSGGSCGFLGIILPVYSWGLPRIVETFLRTTLPGLLAGRAGQRPYVWAVFTCGDDIGYADRLLRRALAKSGLTLDAVFSVQMPNTYVCLPGFTTDSDAVAARKVEATRDALPLIAADVRARRTVTRVERGAAARIKTALLRPLFNALLVKDTPFRASDACTACGLCARSCPCRDIVITDRRPRWGHTACTACLRCFHQCPRRAIDWGTHTRGKSQKAPLPPQSP